MKAAAAHLSVPLFAAGSLTGPNGDSIEPAHLHPLGHLSDAQLGQRLAARPVFVSSRGGGGGGGCTRMDTVACGDTPVSSYVRAAFSCSFLATHKHDCM